MRYSLDWGWAKQRSYATLVPFPRSAASLIYLFYFMTYYIEIKGYFSLLIAFMFYSFEKIIFHLYMLLFFLSQSLLPDYQRLLSSMPSRRLNTSKLIENSGECSLIYNIDGDFSASWSPVNKKVCFIILRNSSYLNICLSCFDDCHRLIVFAFDIIFCNHIHFNNLSFSIMDMQNIFKISW